MGVYFFFIIGMPGETEEDVLRTIEYAKEVGPDEAYFSIATPYPGTDLYTTCLERGYIPKDYDVTLMKPTQSLIETEWLSRKRVAELCTFAYSEWEVAKKASRFNEAPDTGLSRRGGVYTFA
jgi:anaerobic magnesium-protoporphyrin IX monomethyl ester cyclase